MNKQELHKFIVDIRQSEYTLDEAMSILFDEAQEISRGVWELQASDFETRTHMVMERLGYKSNSALLRIQKAKRNQIAGFLTQEEEKLLQREELKTFSSPSKPQLTHLEQKAEENWCRLRFAWLIEMFLEHGAELPKLVCSEAITPPPEVEFNYMLPKQRSAGSKQSDTEVQKKEELFIVPEDVILLQRQLIEPIYQGSISTLKQALDRGLSLPLATKQLDMGIVFDLVLNDVHERYALATLEKKAIPDAILFYQHERKRIAGVMTNEEREFYEQKLLPPEQTPSKQQDKEAEKDEQTSDEDVEEVVDAVKSEIAEKMSDKKIVQKEEETEMEEVD